MKPNIFDITLCKSWQHFKGIRDVIKCPNCNARGCDSCKHTGIENYKEFGY